jgi:tetratricopeptide (TPR) repeat protein
MNWITLLRSLQCDFIKRLTSGSLLHCETEGYYSELTIISGERLKILREFCWQMAEKYKRAMPVRTVFINNLKGKLGEEVIKERLADLITEVDYDKKFGGDGKVDFTLTDNSSIGIAVKSRHGSIDKVRWSISSEEVQKNTVVVCILIQEEVNEAQSEYHLFLAGFLPTSMIKLKTGKISFGIEQILYGGGLQCYLEQLDAHNQVSPQYKPESAVNDALLTNNEDFNWFYVKLGDECFRKGEYEGAVNAYNEALKVNHDDIDIYYKRGCAYYNLEDYEQAIHDYNQVLKFNPDFPSIYHKLGNIHYYLGNYDGAIEDYTLAIKINSYDSTAYKNRAYVRSKIGDYQGAIEDYTQAIKISPDNASQNLDQANQNRNELDYYHNNSLENSQDADSYRNRAKFRYDLGDYQGAIQDYTQVIILDPHDFNAYHCRGNVRFDLGDYEAAIQDYSQALGINPYDADAFYQRGNTRYLLKDKSGAIEDFRKATDLYQKKGNFTQHKNVQERILELEIEDSLDILNF